MKKIIFIKIIIALTLSCNAQIIPLEQHNVYLEKGKEIQDGTYFKDVNNILNKFTGTWTSTFNNNTYELYIIKITYHSKIRSLTIDELELRYRITDENGSILMDTTNLSNDNTLVVRGYYLQKNNLYFMTYVGEDANCGQSGQFALGIPSDTPNTMNFYYAVSNDMRLASDCPSGDAIQLFPDGEKFSFKRQ